jgi:hypothetical protein
MWKRSCAWGEVRRIFVEGLHYLRKMGAKIFEHCGEKLGGGSMEEPELEQKVRRPCRDSMCSLSKTVPISLL